MKKFKKWFKRLIVFGLIIAVFIVTVNGVVIGTTQAYVFTSENEVPKADVYMVLGAYVFPSGNPSTVLRDRLDTAIDVANNEDIKFLLSGDHGQIEYDEVNNMKAYLIEQGIPQENIYLDHAGFSTYESMYRARDIFEVDSMVVFTQDFHINRSVYLARNMGIDAYGVPSDKHFYYKILKYQVRESLARVKDFMMVNVFKPEPTYLGDKIPILESLASDTWD